MTQGSDKAEFLRYRWYYRANSPERAALFQTGWFTLGLLTQTLIVHMIRTEKVPFLQAVRWLWRAGGVGMGRAHFAYIL